MIEAPNRLLKEYYERAGLDGDIFWQRRSERDIGRILEGNWSKSGRACPPQRAHKEM